MRNKLLAAWIQRLRRGGEKLCEVLRLGLRPRARSSPVRLGEVSRALPGDVAKPLGRPETDSAAASESLSLLELL